MPHTVEFSEDLKVRIRDAGRAIHDVLPFLDDAEECGVNCIQQRALLDVLRSTLAKIEEKFMQSKAEGA